MSEEWVSPDGRIRKVVVSGGGKWGRKPSENSRCTVNITESPLLAEFRETVVTVGDGDGDLWRTLDVCLCTMSVGEKSRFTCDGMCLVVELLDLGFDGFLFEWDACKKYGLAMHHKEKGVQLFKEKRSRESAFRFSKALKILHSIPMDIENPPSIVDGVSSSDIDSLKGTLYNNLASCYYRNRIWHKVVDLCNKVFTYDDSNVKALFRIGVAYHNDGILEEAFKALSRALEIEPDNKACAEHLYLVKADMRNEQIKVNAMVKKMFI